MELLEDGIVVIDQGKIPLEQPFVVRQLAVEDARLASRCMCPRNLETVSMQVSVPYLFI